MADRGGPQLYSIAAHRGFADALVAGLVPRYGHGEMGLAQLTLLLPSTRAIRIVTEAFIRHSGGGDAPGLLMPRMAVVGDLDLDETLGPLLDPMGGADIPPAVTPTRRWLRLAELIHAERPELQGAILLRKAREIAATMDRLLVEDIGPEELQQDRVLDLLGDLSGHWQDSLRLFARVQARWLAELTVSGELDAASRRNRLFDHAARRWKENPPASPIVAAGVTSAAPALARLLKVVCQLPQGAVILPDLDLSMADDVWDELGSAGAPRDDGAPFARGDAVTHPQYHLKLLLARMGVARGEIQQWHRAGLGKGPPERSHAISSLFLPPQASKCWIDLPSEKRRLSGVRLMELANLEEQAQAIALLARQALDQDERRVAIITPDRSLASRVVAHLRRWNISADDSAGRPLAQTPAARVLLLLAETMADGAAPVPLMALLQHPLVKGQDARADWLDNARALELELRGPRPAPGLEQLRKIVARAGKSRAILPQWWEGVEATLDPVMALAQADEIRLCDALDALCIAGEALCGDALWAREDGRALASLVEDIGFHAAQVGTAIAPDELPGVLRDAMDQIAVRPPYGGHPRLAIYGLLESRMSRADLVICAGLNEGVWPATPAQDALLAPAVLRALGVPGADFRIGLSAHDLASALGAADVVLARARREVDGPAIPSRFWLRVKALLGNDLLDRHSEKDIPAIARSLDAAPPAAPYAQPRPMPNAQQRKVDLSVTGLDRLRGDPYQFYAQTILQLRKLDALDALPSAAWQGEAAHEILEIWHKQGGSLHPIAERVLDERNAHPVMRGLWRPRLLAALDWIEAEMALMTDRKVLAVEKWGALEMDGVKIRGRADRIDQMDDGTLAIVDYKTGSPPSGAMVEGGFALQLGLIGLMAQAGGIDGVHGEPTHFEYWSLGKDPKGNSETGFGYRLERVKTARAKGLAREEYLAGTQGFLQDAITRWITGNEPFTARLNPNLPSYDDYDQLMRLDEWQARSDQGQGQ